jgi:type IV pilus assembly protein PilE
MNMTSLRKRAVSGFTLIELLIAVAIVAILAAVAFPAYTSQIAKGKSNECRAGVLQSMQQQERYFSQYNKYVTFTAGATTAKTKSFSGDNLNNSACTILAQQCGTEDLSSCIELRAEPRASFKDPAWQYVALDSYGQKSCKVGTTTYSGASPNPPTGERVCWP